jgi:hypothetical protein
MRQREPISPTLRPRFKRRIDPTLVADQREEFSTEDISMFGTFRNMQMISAAALIGIATMIGTGVSRADDMASLKFENTLNQEVTLDVSDGNPHAASIRNIHLNVPTMNGKPSKLAYYAAFKTPKDKKGNIKLKVTVHCGSSSDSALYTRPPSGNIKVLAGCKLTRS